MEKGKLGGLITLFITVIVGIVLLSSIADYTFESQNIYTFTNNTIDVTSGQDATTGNFTAGTEFQLTENFVVAITTATLVANDTGDLITLTRNTDYTLDTNELERKF